MASMWRTAEERSRIGRIGGLARAKTLSKERLVASAKKARAAQMAKQERAEEWLMRKVTPRDVELGEMSERAFERMSGEECS